jgi:hypothetical protein
MNDESPSAEDPLNITVNVAARSKVGRYFGEVEIRNHLRRLDGKVYEKEDGTFLLKCVRRDLENHRTIIIVFGIDDEDVTVFTQTSDHYDWSAYPTRGHGSLRELANYAARRIK